MTPCTHILRLVSALGIVFILLSCNPPGTGPGNKEGGLSAAQNVSAILLKDTNKLRITWNGPNRGESYEVFRVDVAGNLTWLTGTGAAESEYQDATYPVGQAVSYKGARYE